MSVKLCGTCGERPAVTHYLDRRTGHTVHRALSDHDECRQCHRSRVDHARAPLVADRPDLTLQEICR